MCEPKPIGFKLLFIPSLTAIKLPAKSILTFKFKASSSVFSQADFPARGFSPILDDVQAQAKLNSFKQVFYSTLKGGVYHQAYLYRFEFAHFSSKGAPVTHHGLLSGPYPNAPVLRIDLISSSQDYSRLSSFLLLRDHEYSRWDEHGGIRLARL